MMTSPDPSQILVKAARWTEELRELGQIEEAAAIQLNEVLAASRGERLDRLDDPLLVVMLCGPTAVASYSPVPSTAKEPDQTGSPGPRTESSDSPVRLASSRARPSAETRRPSATTWSPGARRTRSPTTTSATWTWTSVPSRTTTASGASASIRSG